MIRLIKNWWLNRKIQKEWLEWAERTDISLLKKFVREVEFPAPKKYRDWSVQEVYEDLKFTKPRSIKDLKEKNDES